MLQNYYEHRLVPMDDLVNGSSRHMSRGPKCQGPPSIPLKKMSVKETQRITKRQKMTEETKEMFEKRYEVAAFFHLCYGCLALVYRTDVEGFYVGVKERVVS